MADSRAHVLEDKHKPPQLEQRRHLQGTHRDRVAQALARFNTVCSNRQMLFDEEQHALQLSLLAPATPSVILLVSESRPLLKAVACARAVASSTCI